MEAKMNNSFRHTKIGIGCSATVIAILVILFTPVYVVAAEKPIEIKLVTLAPIGTSPHVSLLKMGEKWQKASGGKVKLTVIGSYRAGGEGAIVDKMAIGGIDAALMTVVGLSAVNPDIDALSSIPMVYDSLEELDYVVSKLGPEFASRLEQKGYILLFWSDIGWVRRFSVQPLLHPDDLKKMKVFLWTGGSGQMEIMKDMGLNPVALEPSDILPALSTGMINEVACAPFSANAGQYASVTKHMLAINWGALVGGALIRKQTWEKVPVEMRQELLRIAAETGREIKADGRKESEDAVAAMIKKQRLVVTNPTPQINEEWRRWVRSAYPRVRGSIVPADAFDKVEPLLREYRLNRQLGKR